jgi:hypothetical protein
MNHLALGEEAKIRASARAAPARGGLGGSAGSARSKPNVVNDRLRFRGDAAQPVEVRRSSVHGASLSRRARIAQSASRTGGAGDAAAARRLERR